VEAIYEGISYPSATPEVQIRFRHPLIFITLFCVILTINISQFCKDFFFTRRRKVFILMNVR